MADKKEVGSVLEPEEMVPFKQFQKLDLRVGEIKHAELVPNSRNLIKSQVDFGGEQLQAVSGLAQYFKPEELIGKKFMFIVNLERKKFMGIESQCMIFAAEDKDGNLALMAPQKDIPAGSKIY